MMTSTAFEQANRRTDGKHTAELRVTRYVPDMASLDFVGGTRGSFMLDLPRDMFDGMLSAAHAGIEVSAEFLYYGDRCWLYAGPNGIYAERSMGEHEGSVWARAALPGVGVESS